MEINKQQGVSVETDHFYMVWMYQVYSKEIVDSGRQRHYSLMGLNLVNLMFIVVCA